ncbi:MAG TPA: porin family protein [Prevotella sp.]
MRKIMKTLFVSALLLASVGTLQAQNLWSDVALRTQVGYSIGGTAPIGLPATIRKLNSYDLRPNLMLGVIAHKPLYQKLGVAVALRFENKAMTEDANVKNYHMEMVRGGETISGMFTGDENTKVEQWMFTLPVQATLALNDKLHLRLGPYISYLVSRNFSGYAHDGYLRVDNPTGAKVELGSDVSTRGNYDFSEHMRRVQWGIGAGVDWTVYRHWGVYGELNWGLTGVHHSHFKTIEQTLYPIFATIGITHKIK